MGRNRMTIEEIRALSLEYAKGHVQIGPEFRGPKVRGRRRQQSYAEWFARSLRLGKKAGKAPDVQTNAYLRQDAGDDGLPPW